MRLEWDPGKQTSNVKKNGLDFSFAAHMFASNFAIEVYDRCEEGEHRWHTFAPAGDRVLLVIYSYPDEEEDPTWIRVIGLRAATPAERDRYEKERQRLHGK